jgi:Protein of unknown function (DUF3795)
MKEMTAYCGLHCRECGAFLATRDDDDRKREEIAELWSEQYHADIKPGDINCQGCKSGGLCHFQYCDVCEIRLCARKRKIANCAFCDDYPCGKLEEFFKMAPQSKVSLDALRSALR